MSFTVGGVSRDEPKHLHPGIVFDMNWLLLEDAEVWVNQKQADNFLQATANQTSLIRIRKNSKKRKKGLITANFYQSMY